MTGSVILDSVLIGALLSSSHHVLAYIVRMVRRAIAVTFDRVKQTKTKGARNWIMPP